jgi:ATP-dependent 26S proteasome regulatory subunit
MDPTFIGFLNQWILSQTTKVVLLLEDAESLIESRESGIRSQGMSNLLNVTDGILNDILGTQIIITFNTDLDMIDPALLRPGRLLARKEFAELDYEQSCKLLEYLQIDDLPATDKMTIAEIYSHKNKRKTIEHNIKEKKSKLGF